MAHYYKPEDRANVEQFFVFQFKRRAHNYLSASLLPKEGDSLEWLALMQHHGAPTRLLDFTRSPYVASFFAVEDADSECAVWAIDKDWCKYTSSMKIAHKLDYYHNLTALKFELSNPQFVARIFADVFVKQSPIPCALAVEPYRMNERLTVQQGCFLCPGDVRRSFQENLLDSTEPEEVQRHVKKLVMLPWESARKPFMILGLNEHSFARVCFQESTASLNP